LGLQRPSISENIKLFWITILCQELIAIAAGMNPRALAASLSSLLNLTYVTLAAGNAIWMRASQKKANDPARFGGPFAFLMNKV
jgi:hypothetical protein